MLFPQKINVVASARHANPHNETVVVQNDTAVEFYVAVVGDNGQTELPEGATYTLVCLHLRKQPTEKLGTLQADGNVMFKLTHMELSETGPIQGQVRVYHPVGGRLTSNPFIFHVAPDPTYGAGIKPEDQSIIEQVIGEGPGIIAEAKKETELNITERARLTGAVGGALSSLADDKAQALLEMSQSKAAADESAQTALQAAGNADQERERLTQEVSGKITEVDNARTATVEATEEALGAADLAKQEAEAARLQKEEVQEVLGAGPVFSVNGETGSVTGLALQSDLDAANQQLAEKANEAEVFLKSQGININDMDEPTRQTFLEAQGIDVNYVLGKENVKPENTTFIKAGKNLVNPADISLNMIISGVTGEPTANANYFLTGFIPIIAGEKIALSNPRNIGIFNIEKVFQPSNYTPNASNGNIVITAPYNGFIRAIFLNQYLPTAQIEKGSVVTPYEPYSATLEGVATPADKRVAELEIKVNDLTSVEGTSSLQVVKVGDSFTLKSPFADGKTLSIETQKNGSRNGAFNFIRTRLNEELIHANDDDITPIRTHYTVGANHGFPVLEVTAAGKTTADLGSKWTDGTRVFTLLRVDGSVLQFGFPYALTSNSISITTTLPTTNLTHASGATNTTDIPVGYALKQLHPSTKNISVGYFLDGKEVTADGIHSGEKIQVRESYDILDYKSIIDYAQANIGKDYRNNMAQIQPLARFGITYDFAENLNCTVYHNLRAYKSFSLLNTWFVQTAPLAFSNHKLMQYIPNVKIKNGYDFKNILDMSTLAENLLFTHQDSVDPAIPPNRTTQWLIDKTSGKRKVGFNMGYIVDKSDSKNTVRVANSLNTWDVRTSLKNYPVVIGDKALVAGEFYSYIAYRNYLPPTTPTTLTNLTSVEVGSETYIYIDSHINRSFDSIKMPEHVGKTIQVVDKSADFTLHSNIVDADGILFSVLNGYGYAILKI